MTDAFHSIESGLREKVIEHLFVGDLLRILWQRGMRDIEVLRTEVDRAGYDIVLEANGVMRHVQLKASHKTARTARVGIHVSLESKPSGCVIWVFFDPDTMTLGPFLWYGGDPGERIPSLGDRIGKHSKGNSQGHKAERPNIRMLNKGQFTSINSAEDLIDVLFGDVERDETAPAA
ncbi:MAG: hypothetical protein RIM72_16160 [Alphaproteobacteria bacterium]